MSKYFTKLGKRSGFSFEERELNKFPLGECRVQNVCWLDEEGIMNVFDGSMDVIIPFGDYVKMCMGEKKGDTAIETIRKYLSQKT